MKSSYVYHIVLVVILALPTSLSCSQQASLSQKSSPQKQSQEKAKAQQPQQKYWTKTRIFFTTIGSAATLMMAAMAGVIAKAKVQEHMYAPYVDFRKDLRQKKSLREVEQLKTSEKYKKLAQTDEGKKLLEDWYSGKLVILFYDLDYELSTRNLPSHFFGKSDDINKEERGRTALYAAINANLSVDLIKRMIDLGADVTQQSTFYRQTPLQLISWELFRLRNAMNTSSDAETRNKLALEIDNLQAIEKLIKETIVQKSNTQ